jgi:NAD-dependent deacetylase
MLYLTAKPNGAHLKLAELELAGKLSSVITQNIDGLHQMAGSRCVFELHGSIHRNYCVKCGRYHTLNELLSRLEKDKIPRCDCGGILKPDVVLYGEGLDDGIISGSIEAISRADLLIVGGTSLNVYPAAGLIRFYKGNRIVLINKTQTPFDREATLVIRESIDGVLGKIKC